MKQTQKAQNEPQPHTPSTTQLPSRTPAPQRRTYAQNRNDGSDREKENLDTHETDSPKQCDFGSKSERITPSRRSQILSQFERYNVQTPSTWKTRSVESSSECFNIQPAKHGSTSDQFKSHTLTPRSKSKYEHLIKNLTGMATMSLSDPVVDVAARTLNTIDKGNKNLLR